ncbi:hypothetical protein HDV05_000915 [Chytridiales sp. JEL 0842]|nr:hypothetical protein HDV05_000915 [Chytridiales sp. JEL 0842]
MNRSGNFDSERSQHTETGESSRDQRHRKDDDDGDNDNQRRNTRDDERSTVKRSRSERDSKRHHANDSSNSSDSDSDHNNKSSNHSKHHHKEKKAKSSSSSKKSKKSSSKKHHRRDESPSSSSSSSSSESSDDSDSIKKARMGKPRISADDYYTKSAEYIVWLREKKGMYMNAMSSKESHSMFKKFVKRWNRGKLNAKYYQGINSTDLSSTERSGYKWKIKQMTENEMAKIDDAKDSVAAMTTSARGLSGPNIPSGIISTTTRPNSSDNRGSRGGPAPTGSNQIPLGKRGAGAVDEEMDEEDRRRYEAGLRKKQRNMERKNHEADLEELVPKASGREAQIEKRKAINSYHKQERDIDVEMNESDLLGGGDSFQAALPRERARKQKSEARKVQKTAVVSEKAMEYRAKEDATMAMLRDLAKRHHPQA